VTHQYRPGRLATLYLVVGTGALAAAAFIGWVMRRAW
jgi:hypothetical protein